MDWPIENLPVAGRARSGRSEGKPAAPPGPADVDADPGAQSLADYAECSDCGWAKCSREAFDRGDWQEVIAGHQLESHDPAEWLRYGVALLQTIEPGPDTGNQQQQAALAFVQAAKEGAPPEAVQAAQRQSLLLSLEQAMQQRV